MQGETVLFIQGKGKTSKGDFVKISEPVMAAIRGYLALRGEVKDDEPLFASTAHRNAGQRLTTRSISGICKQAMIRAGFNSPRLTAHSLRHSAVTLALLAGVSIQEVSQFARHSSINITSQQRNFRIKKGEQRTWPDVKHMTRQARKEAKNS